MEVRLVQVLSDSACSGVLLLGEAGMGKTALSESVIERLQPMRGVAGIRGSAALQEVAYGALSEWLGGTAGGDDLRPLAIMRRVVDSLRASCPPELGLPLFLVDDAHYLDAASSMLLAQLVGGREIQVLLLARPQPGLPPGFDDLVADGILVTATLERLSLDEVGTFCSSVLGGPVTGSVALVVESLTLGNPAMVRLLLADGLTREFISEGNGVWHISPQLPQVSVRLIDFVHHDLSRLDPEQRTAMEFIALGEPIPAEHARQRIEHAVLQGLLNQSWVRTLENGSLVPRHPLHGEALRESVPAARRVLLQRDILELASEAPLDVGEVLRRAAVAHGAGVALDDDILLASATVANRRHDGLSALHAVRAIRTPALLGRGLVESAREAAGRGQFDEALDLVEEAFAHRPTPDVIREGILLSLELRARRDERASALLQDLDRWDLLLRDGGTASPADVLDVTVGRGVVSLMTDDVGFDLAAMREVVSAGLARPATEIAGLLVLAGHCIGSGRPAEAMSLVSRALSLVGTDADTLAYQAHAAGLELLAFITAGEWDQAGAAFNRHYDAGTRSGRYFAVWLDVLNGVRALREGRFTTAQVRLFSATEDLRSADHFFILPWVSGLAAYAAALSGNLRRAGLLVEVTASNGTGGTGLTRKLGRVYMTSVAAVLSADQEGPRALVRLADDAEDCGLPLVAATALDQAIMLGNAGVVGRLAAITQTFQGREQELLHAFAAASAASDAQQLIDVGDAALSVDCRPLAAGCYERARELYDKRRDTAAARSAQRRLAGASAGLEGPVNGRSVRLPVAVSLTPREVAIVALVLEGLSNREIAERHGTSVRTVEGHLYRIFTKFGISRREDLRLFVPDN
jgi:DNA-binding CsgD family transcriptional regulator